MKHSEFKFKTFDGLRLFGQSWQPDDVQSRAVICLVHGLGEHSGRYVHVADSLTQAGYALISFDLRGHGKSQGPRGHTPSCEALLNDINFFLNEADKNFPELPRGRWALEHASEFPLPLLLMHGGDDKITSLEASRKFASKVTEKCTFRIWDGLYHDIHNESEKQAVFAFLISWLNEII